MKERKTYLSVLVAAMALMCSCEDFRDSHMVEDTIYLRSESADLIQDYSVFDALFRIGVIKAGKGRTPATVELGIAPADTVLVYNQRHNTDYIPLSRSLYNSEAIDGNVISFSAAESRVKVDVEWDPQAMVNKMLSEKDNFVIPVYIKNASLKVSDSKYLLLIHPVLSSVTVSAPDYSVSCQAGGRTTCKVGVKIDNAISGHDVKIKLNYTPKVVLANGINYVEAPAGSIKLVKEEVIIPAGAQEISVAVDLDMAGIADSISHIAGEISIVEAEVVIENGKNIDFIPVLNDKMILRVIKTRL